MQVDPDVAELHFLRGVRLEAEPGQLREAMAAYERAVNCAPTTPRRGWRSGFSSSRAATTPLRSRTSKRRNASSRRFLRSTSTSVMPTERPSAGATPSVPIASPRSAIEAPRGALRPGPALPHRGRRLSGSRRAHRVREGRRRVQDLSSRDGAASGEGRPVGGVSSGLGSDDQARPTSART